MFYALFNGKKIYPYPRGIALCPSCGERVLAKCGKVNVWHWSHESRIDCDFWHERESQWHLDWKNITTPSNVEVSITKEGIKHIADIQIKGSVIELQHSPISVTEIAKREEFYENMFWIFDIRDCKDRFKIYNKGGYYSFKWKHARKSICSASKPIYLDMGNEIFKIKKIYLDHGCAGWGHLFTKKDFIKNIIKE